MVRLLPPLLGLLGCESFPPLAGGGNNAGSGTRGGAAPWALGRNGGVVANVVLLGCANGPSAMAAAATQEEGGESFKRVARAIHS